LFGLNNRLCGPQQVWSPARSGCGVRIMFGRTSFPVRTLVLGLGFLLVFSERLYAGVDANGREDFFEMSIEELMEVDVTLASKKEEELFKTPAAVYVLTSEDIRRSGATSIPEALRMVPGIEVSRIDNNKWGITARGFNGMYAEKLLVLIDGRSVYTPLFAGVYWDVQDVMLEDVKRIEVIRGPGGTLWGANAVNGIINIVTKNAKDTQGTLLTVGAGTEERGFSNLRYGGKLGKDSYYRVYSKYFNRDEGVYADGGTAADDSDVFRGGFRIDWEGEPQDHITLQGDGYNGRYGQKIPRTSLSVPYMTYPDDTIDVSGGNLLGRWSRRYSETSGIALQFYYDRTERAMVNLGETRDTFDVDFQHDFQWGSRHNIVWGLGCRYTRDNTDGTYTISFEPAHRRDKLFSGFVQDDIILVRDLLRFIIGSKFEENDYTGFEFQPSARLLWTPDKRNTVWAAFTRAVQTPARAQSDMQDNYLVINPALVYSFSGSDDLKSQELKSYEIGYRTKVNEKLLFDITGFYNDYDHLYSTEYNPTALSKKFDNKLYGETYGAEISTHWQVKKNWRLIAGYSLLEIQVHRRDSSTDTVHESQYEDKSPRNMFSVRSYLDLPGNFEFDTAAYYVDSIPYYNIPGYVRLDARLGWHITKDMELSVVGQNLLDSHHPEMDDDAVIAAEVQRGVFAQLSYKF